MARYRKPETAPRDGTYIIGLFERPNKRAIALLASYDREYAETVDVGKDDPQWMKDVARQHVERLRDDPVHFFQPLNHDADNGLEVGRMIGWRPAPKPLS